MKIRKSLSSLARVACAAVVAVAATSSALAQAPARPAGGANVPNGRIAIINVSVFPQQVNELKRAIEALNQRFEPRTKELLGLRDQISSIEAQVKQGTIAADQAATLSDQYERLKRDYQRRSEDLSAEAKKAYDTTTGPIREKLSSQLEKYAASHNVVLIIEIGGAVNINSIFYAAKGMNITDDFIAAYNQANP